MNKKLKTIKKLNLGCSNKVLDGFINVDLESHKGVDLIHDLNKYPLPFDEDSIEYILASHILEHLEDPLKFMLELHRICKEGAVIDIYVPHFSSFTTYAELTHKRGLSYFTFGENWMNKQLYKKFRVQKKLNFTRINFKFLNRFL